MNNMKPQIYAIIADDIIEKIKNGTYQSNEKLPSEREFSKYYDVSVSSIQKALKKLMEQNYIYSKERMGYFVMPPKFNEYIFYYNDEIFINTIITKEISLPVLFFNGNELEKTLGVRVKGILYRKCKLSSKTLINYEEKYIFLQKNSIKTLSKQIDHSKILENIEKYSAQNTIEITAGYLPDSLEIDINDKVPFFLICKKSYDRYGKLISIARNYYRYNKMKLYCYSE